MKSEYKGSVVAIRAVEDSIRATHKYTKGIFRKPAAHPIQGEEFPSKVLWEYYEVYPDIEVSWDMPIIDAILLLSGPSATPCYNVYFKYDYRDNQAAVIVNDGPVAIKELARAIPGFSDSLAIVIAGGNGHKNT